MRYCFYCGEGMPDNAIFCGKCGKEQMRELYNTNHVTQKSLSLSEPQPKNEIASEKSNHKTLTTVNEKPLELSLKKLEYIKLAIMVFTILSCISAMSTLIELINIKSWIIEYFPTLSDVAEGYSEYILPLLKFRLTINICLTISFLFWVYQIYKYSSVISQNDMRYSNWWAFGGFLIPFINFFRPYQVVMDIWKANVSQSDTSRVLVWWITYLLSIIATVVFSGISKKYIDVAHSGYGLIPSIDYLSYALIANLFTILANMVLVIVISPNVDSRINKFIETRQIST